MHFRSRMGIALASVAALVALVGVVAPASAGKKLKTAEATTAVPPVTATEFVHGTSATCKKKTKAISGGWSSEQDVESPGTKAVLPVRSLREGKRSWLTDGFNLGDQSSNLTVFAYCRAEKLKSKIGTATAPLGNGLTLSTGTATAKCPKGKKIISGGVSASEDDLTPPDTFVLIATESRRIGRRTWQASGLNFGSDARDVIAQANCRKGKALKQREDSFTFDAPSGEIGTVTAKCKKTERVVSGGFDADHNFGDASIYLSRWHKQGKRRWVAEAFGGGSEPGTLTVYAYCEKKK